MKKLLFMVLAIAVFAGCSKEESTVLSEGDKITRNLKPIDSPLRDFLRPTDIWAELTTYGYSEPNGKGEETLLYSEEMVMSLVNKWIPWEDLVFGENQLIKYIGMTKEVRCNHYYDFDILKIENNTFYFARNGEEYYLTVLGYDKDNYHLWIETDCFDIERNYQRKYGRADSFACVRMLLQNTTQTYYPKLDSSSRAGWLSEDEIEPIEVDYPVVLPENIFEVAEDAPIWKPTCAMALMYDPEEQLYSKDKLILTRARAVGGYANMWIKFIDGVAYVINYHKNEITGEESLTFSKCDDLQNHLLPLTSEEIVFAGDDYMSIIEEPYISYQIEGWFYYDPDWIEPNYIKCYNLSKGTQEDLNKIKELYDNPDVKKYFSDSKSY